LSWGFTVPPIARDSFDEAVDAAVAQGQDLSLPGVADDVAAAKAAMKDLAKRVKRPRVGGSAGGHCLQADEGSNWSDSLNASVYGLPEEGA
jgi:hypothetical protein